MDYLIDCACGHDLTSHGDTGCRNHSACGCLRTRLGALDSAIEDARINPWAHYLRNPADEGDGTAA